VVASPVTGAVNVASGEAIAIRDLALLLARLAGRPDLLRLGGRPDRPGEVGTMVADIRRLRREVGFAERSDLPAELGAVLAALREEAAQAEPGSGRSGAMTASDPPNCR
jgi:nucleoside-diphosphate-sugar epimerase